MKKWYAINTKPHSEFKVINYLNYNSVETFMPKIFINRSHAGKKDKVIKPLFPSYLFASIDINNSSFRKINNTFGVKSILGYGKDAIFLISWIIGIRIVASLIWSNLFYTKYSTIRGAYGN